MKISRSSALVLLGSLFILFIAALAGSSSAATIDGRCKAFKPSTNIDLIDPERARLAQVQVITDNMTKDDPLTIEYEHGAAYWVGAVEQLRGSEEEYFNLQIVSRRKAPGLHVRIEWPVTSPSDIDIGLFDVYSNMVAYSDAANIPVMDDVNDRIYYEGYGGLGYEYIEGARTSNCEGFTLLSWAGRSAGTSVTLKVWLGPQTDHYDH